jgi:hypothetical protein
VFVLAEDAAGQRLHAAVRKRLRDREGVDLFTWLELDGEPVLRGAADGPPPHGAVAVVERGGETLRFCPGGPTADRRGDSWQMDGDPATLAGSIDRGIFDSAAYPNALGRLWAALQAPHAGEILLSAAVGYELVDWGGVTHCPGGSHGSLEAGDSLGPLVLCGLDPETVPERDQWTIADVAGLVRAHFDAGAPAAEPPRAPAFAGRS